MVFTLGQRRIRSSARLEISVATLSNSEKDVYYRIDSMKSVKEHAWSARQITIAKSVFRDEDGVDLMVMSEIACAGADEGKRRGWGGELT